MKDVKSFWLAEELSPRNTTPISLRHLTNDDLLKVRLAQERSSIKQIQQRTGKLARHNLEELIEERRRKQLGNNVHRSLKSSMNNVQMAMKNDLIQQAKHLSRSYRTEKIEFLPRKLFPVLEPLKTKNRSNISSSSSYTQYRFLSR